MSKSEKMTFKQWHAELKNLAKKHKLSWLIPPAKDYPTDAYDDGLTPNEELGEQYSAVTD